MRHSRRIFVAAVLSFGGGLVGCGGGGGSESSGAAGALSPSGRFVVRDVTPGDLLKPVATGAVVGFDATSVSSSGWVAGTVYTQPDSVTTDNAIYYRSRFPVLVDIDRRTTTRLRAEGPQSSVLEQGIVAAVSAQGDVYGTLVQPGTGGNSTLYDFRSVKATGKTMVRPGSLNGPVPNAVSNAGQYLVPQKTNHFDPPTNTDAVADYAAPAAAPRVIVSPVAGQTVHASYINADGVVVGRLLPSVGTQPTRTFLWKDGVATVLPAPSGTLETFPLGISDDGLVVGSFFESAGGRRLVTWKNEQVTVLPALPGNPTRLAVGGISAQGDILVAVSPETPGNASYRLWQQSRGAWLDLTADVTGSRLPVFPRALLQDGRLLCTTPTKLYTFTPR